MEKCKCGYSKQDHLPKSNRFLSFHSRKGLCALSISGKSSVFYHDKLELLMYGPNFSIRFLKQISAPQAVLQECSFFSVLALSFKIIAVQRYRKGLK